MHSASKQHKTGSFWSWCSKTPPKLQHAFRHLNQLPWSFLCPGDGLAHTWAMPSLITFFALMPFHISTSFPQPFSPLLPAPPLCPLDGWWKSDVPHLFLGTQELWAALFLAQEDSIHILPAYSKSSDSHWTEQSVGTASEIHLLLYKDLGLRKYNDSRWL